jgi:FkbM family methyltransferase
MKNLFRDIFSRPIFQPFFDIILNTSLKAMNIGQGQNVETSGESSVFDILDRVMATKQAMVFDVGAHTGEWLSLFKKKYTKKSIVYSFEPSRESYTELSAIRMEHFFAHNIAFGDAIGTANLTGDVIGSSGMRITRLDNTDGNHIEHINITTIDQFCQDHTIREIDLLKMDIEGYELKALAGAKNILAAGSIKLIQFEYGAPSSEKYSLKEFFDLLSEHYEICRILKHGHCCLPKYRHYYEIMTVTNFIAIRKDLYASYFS